MLVMKKILSVIAAVLMCVLIFCGCERSDTNGAQSGTQASTGESSESGTESDKLVLMSGDYADAVRCGANMVRVGSAIFGARNYQK